MVVIAILKTSGVPKTLDTVIAGESLFNDGIGVVFMIILELSSAGREVTAGRTMWFFTQEAVGGLALGLAIGYLPTCCSNWSIINSLR